MPTNTTNLSLINVSSLSGTAAPSTKMSLQANLQASSTVDGSYTAGDMAAGNVTPDFTRTVNVYDSQGGQQPITFSFVKTGANTWAYEANYAGTASNVTSTAAQPGHASPSTPTARSRMSTALRRPSGNIAMTIPWSASSGLASQTLSVNLGTVSGTSGIDAV